MIFIRDSLELIAICYVIGWLLRLAAAVADLEEKVNAKPPQTLDEEIEANPDWYSDSWPNN